MRPYGMCRKIYRNVTDLKLYGAKSSIPMCPYGTRMYKEIYCNVTDLRLRGTKSPFPMRTQDKHG